MNRFGISQQGRPGDNWLAETVRWAWRTRIQVHLNIDLRTRLWTAGRNRSRARVRLEPARPVAGGAGRRPGDHGSRSRLSAPASRSRSSMRPARCVATTAVFPHEPQRKWDEALAILGKLAIAHRVDLIAIGNGTASRETDKLATELVKALPDLKMTKVVVSEAGASVYSASAFASEELPELDVTLRGAVSIARRLQDPLAELVKIDPKAIGVGQYQHDLGESHLARSLDTVVEDCVNAVGVDVNTASAPLLARVSGIGPGLAQSIVRASRCQRCVQIAQGAEGRAAARGQGIRAMRRLPADQWRRRSTRCVRRASRGLSGGAADPCRDQERHQGADRQWRDRAPAESAEFRRRCVSDFPR